MGGIFRVEIHNMWFGSQCVHGHDCRRRLHRRQMVHTRENPTGRRPSTITNNERHHFTIRVHNDGSRTALNIDFDQTRDFIQWEGPTSGLTNMANGLREVPNTRRRSWLSSYSSRSTFHKARIRMLSGTIHRDVITDADRQEDLQNGFVRLVGEKRSDVKVGVARFVVNQADMTGPGITEQRWPLITHVTSRFCDDYYGAHAASRLKCPIPSGAKSFTVVGYNDSSRTAKFVVLIDGKLVHDSGETGIAVIKADIPAKASQLELVADPLGGYDYDRTYWCFPRFHAVAAERVTDKMLDGKAGKLKFHIASSKVGSATLTHNQPIGGLNSVPVHFRDAEPCDEFLFAHAPSTVTYEVPKGMTRFTAVGYNTMSQSVKYEVWANSHRIYESSQAGIVPIDVNFSTTVRKRLN